MRCIGCRANRLCEWKIFTCEPYRAGGSNPNIKFDRIIRYRRCAKPAGPNASKLDIWEDREGKRLVGGRDTMVIAIPGMLRYLDVELSAIGVKMKFNIEP